MLSLKAFLGLDANGFDVGVKRAQSTAQKFSASVSSSLAGAFTAGAVLAGINKLDDMIKALQERAQQIKIGTSQSGFDSTTFQQFDNTLKATGMSADRAFNSLEKLAEATEKIRKGEDAGNKLAESFAVFGITMDDIRRKDYRTLFFEISAAMKSMAVDAQSLGALGNLLGGKAGDLVPAMKMGFDSTIANRGVMDRSDLEELEKLNKLALESTAPWKTFGNEVLLALTKMKTGLLQLSLGTGALGMITRFIGGGEGDGGLTDRLQKRLTEAQQEKAKRELEKAKEAARKSEMDKVRNRFKGEAPAYDPVKQVMSGDRQNLSPGNINPLQRMGAHIAAARAENGALRELQQIRQNTAQIAKKVDLLPGNRPAGGNPSEVTYY